MPPFSVFLTNAEQLRLAGRTTPLRQLARHLKQMRRAEYAEQDGLALYQTLVDLIVELHGLNGLDTFMAALGA